MENKKLNSCMMLAMNFGTAIDIESVFKDSDLTDYGIEYDSHITIFLAKENYIPKDNLLGDTEIILGDSYWDFMDLLKSDTKFRLLDFFELGKFEGSVSDYLVMRLKSSTEFWNTFGILNKSLSRKYDIVSDYDTYRPHMTLAELQPGTSEKYLEDKKLLGVLETAKVGFEDLIISYSSDVSDRNSWSQYSITSFHAVDRHLRNESYLKRIKK